MNASTAEYCEYALRLAALGRRRGRGTHCGAARRARPPLCSASIACSGPPCASHYRSPSPRGQSARCCYPPRAAPRRQNAARVSRSRCRLRGQARRRASIDDARRESAHAVWRGRGSSHRLSPAESYPASSAPTGSSCSPHRQRVVRPRGHLPPLRTAHARKRVNPTTGACPRHARARHSRMGPHLRWCRRTRFRNQPPRGSEQIGPR